jgi:hypothetical protein
MQGWMALVLSLLVALFERAAHPARAPLCRESSDPMVTPLKTVPAGRSDSAGRWKIYFRESCPPAEDLHRAAAVTSSSSPSSACIPASSAATSSSVPPPLATAVLPPLAVQPMSSLASTPCCWCCHAVCTALPSCSCAGCLGPNPKLSLAAVLPTCAVPCCASVPCLACDSSSCCCLLERPQVVPRVRIQ